MGQAAARIAYACTGRLGDWYVPARRGPALDLACRCMPRRVLVGLSAGHRLSQGIGKRAQAPTRDHSQALFSRVIMLVFISLHILLAALAGLCALLSMPNMLFSRFPTCLRAAAMLAMLSLSCWHLASGHACLRAILLCDLGDWGWGPVWGCVIDVVWM